MKKVFSFLSALSFALIFAFAPKAYAADLNDVSSDFWASRQINEMVTDGVMSVDSNSNFNPDGSVQRAEFTSMLVKVLGLGNSEIHVENPFSDVTLSTQYYEDILRSEQKSLVYGYPDGTFKPAQDIKKEEVTSVMSHITVADVADTAILDSFEDAGLIPAWAKEAYAKAVKFNLYVNYPNSMKFEPQRNITRAETAVLLSKLKSLINLVKEEHKAKADVEKVLGEEHLSINKDALSNIVTVTNKRVIIEEGNVIKVSFINKFKGKKANVGDSVVFTTTTDISTDEGRVLFPAGSTFYAKVEDIVAPRFWNKSGAVKFNFEKAELSNGAVVNMDGTVFNKKDGWLKKASVKKLGAYTLGGLVMGGAVGSAIGIPTKEEGLAYGVALPSGAALGFITGLITKGSYFDAGMGDEVYVKLNAPVTLTDSI